MVCKKAMTAMMMEHAKALHFLAHNTLHMLGLAQQIPTDFTGIEERTDRKNDVRREYIHVFVQVRVALDGTHTY